MKLLKRIHFISQDIGDFINSKDGWIFYIIVIGLTFGFSNNNIQKYLSGILNFNFYDIVGLNIDYDLSQKIIDTRIVNISAIFSISFVIIGFLINNLKKYSEDTYDMIYKNIKLFPILYTSLTVISCLIIVSLLRNSLNPNTFNNLIVWGTFLIILILFLIGYLFKKVIFQIKPSNVYKYFFHEIREAAERVNWGYKPTKSKEKLAELKLSLEERLMSSSASGDTENLKLILNIYEEICLLDL